MKVNARRTLRRRLRTTAIACTAFVIGSLAPAAASDAGSIDDYVKRYDHPMGSQIAKHEGRGNPVIGGPLIIQATVSGIDVSGHQGNVDWNYWWNQGKRFAYVKATEGTGYKNPYFAQQYNGSYNRGFIRGSYHFALPDRSTGATQADYFVNNGGGWSRDGKTLPGALDVEWNPYGSTCYGKTRSGMVAWIKGFSDRYKYRTGRYPVIYTSASWWSQCTGNIAGFKSTNPLWVARYSSTPGTLPYDWTVWTFWQYTSSPIDQNYFNGAYDRLQALANG